MFEGPKKGIFEPGQTVWYLCWEAYKVVECKYIKSFGLLHRLKCDDGHRDLVVGQYDVWEEYLPAVSNSHS